MVTNNVTFRLFGILYSVSVQRIFSEYLIWGRPPVLGAGDIMVNKTYVWSLYFSREDKD